MENKIQEIINEIKKADSPVGFDALRTHAIILNELRTINKRLEAIEKAHQH